MPTPTKEVFPTPDSSTAEAPDSPAAFGYSCLLCRQRKVRCNQKQPCDNCTRAGKQCSFIAPVRGKRKRTKPPKEGMHARLRRYEELLKSHGVPLGPAADESDDESLSGSEPGDSQRPAPRAHKVDNGASRVTSDQDPYKLSANAQLLVTKGGASRYYDSGVWARIGQTHFGGPDNAGLTDQIDDWDSKSNPDHSLADEQNAFLLGSAPAMQSLADLHPPVNVLPAFREFFAERVDPLLKILHLPSFWKSLENAVHNAQRVSLSMQALAFSFYLVTVSTMSDSECTTILGTGKVGASRQYRLAARQALIEANFMSTSSLETLQAYSMFLMGARSDYRMDNQYMLSGVAIRMAQRIGLHRDGTNLRLPFFETEMRRRLWWHMVQFDFKLADTLSIRASLDLCACDTKSPHNVEDSDFGPDSAEAPPERTGITGIAISRLRARMIDFFRKLDPSGSVGVRWEALTLIDVTMAQKDALIDELEDNLERQFTRYCDPTEALHNLVQLMVRSSIAKMRLFAHNPRYFAERGVRIPQSERDIVFANATKLLEYAVLIPGNKNLGRYMWQSGAGHLWNSMLYILIEARHRKTGPEVDRMWHLIEKLTSEFPHLFEETAGSAGNAIRRWVLEVWDDYVMAMRDARLPEPLVPEFIGKMRRSLRALSNNMPHPVTNSLEAHQEEHGIAAGDGYGVQQAFQPVPTMLDPPSSYDFPDILAFEMDPNEWSQWDDMVSGNFAFA